MEDKLTYKSAMEEIESLVKLLEENKLDVDELRSIHPYGLKKFRWYAATGLFFL